MTHKKKILLFDFGANIGKVTQHIHTKLSEIYNIQFILYEPDSINITKLEQLTEPPFILHKGVITTANTTIEFYPPRYEARTSGSILKAKGKNFSESVSVQGYDIYEHITMYRQQFSPDYIVVKMDIEGAEYSILEYLEKQNFISQVNLWFIEFHDTKVGISKQITQQYSKYENIIKYDDNIDITKHIIQRCK